VKRRRPRIQAYHAPAVMMSGGKLTVDTVLESRSEKTPVDFVAISLRCVLFTAAGSGKARTTHEEAPYHREWRSEAMTMPRGEHPYKVVFDIPEGLPASYEGADAHVRWVLRVHVSIPWWPDRVATYRIPFAPVEGPPPPTRPAAVATSVDGPRGTEPYMEVALATTLLSAGDVLEGSLSVQNLRGRDVRCIRLAFVETETVRLPSLETREVRRFATRLHEGPPAEGEAIPFRVRLPESATPSFQAGPLSTAWYVELTADVAWRPDVVLSVPLAVSPASDEPRGGRGRIAPVGRERRALVWQAVATRAGLTTDPAAERMVGSQGGVSIDLRTEQREADIWLTAELAWPPFGLDLEIRERRWTDAFTSMAVKSGYAPLDARFSAHAREHAQGTAVVTSDLLAALSAFDEVRVDDGSASLASRGAAHATRHLEPFVSAAIVAARALAAAHSRVPPPLLFASDVAAWQAFAERVRGRLELGRMWIHDGQVGFDRVEVGSVWGRRGELSGSKVAVTIDPPLARVPYSPDDPELSPAARAAYRALEVATRAMHLEPGRVVAELDGKLVDPAVAMPVVELAVALRRALSGMAGTGPFR
jgi:hypothetical protein